VVEVSVGAGMFVGRGTSLRSANPLPSVFSWETGVGTNSSRPVGCWRLSWPGLAAQRATGEEIAGIADCLEVMRTSQTARRVRPGGPGVSSGRGARGPQSDPVSPAAHPTICHGELITKVVVHYDSNHMPQSFRVHIPIYEAIKSGIPCGVPSHGDTLGSVGRAIDRCHRRRPGTCWPFGRPARSAEGTVHGSRQYHPSCTAKEIENLNPGKTPDAIRASAERQMVRGPRAVLLP